MRTINTDLIEKILEVNDKFIKFAENNIFKWSDLTPTQFNILWEIILNDWLWVNELKEKLIVSAPALSQLLGRMEKSGLIERSLAKNDKREIKIKPTKKAKVERLSSGKFSITISEWRNRQIRRMVEKVWSIVKKLKRIRIENIELWNMKEWEYKALTKKEKDELFKRLNIK